MSTTLKLAVLPSEAKDNIFKRFGNWVKGFFNKAKDIFEGLDDNEKEAAILASGLIAAINLKLEEKAADVLAFIKDKFPDFTDSQIQGFLDGWLNVVFNLPKGNAPLGIEKSITLAQKFLKQYKEDHSTWAIISSTAANIIATLISPKTPIEKFINIGVTIYHAIVKPHVEGDDYVVPTPVEDDDGEEDRLNSASNSTLDPDMELHKETLANLGEDTGYNARTDAADMPSSYKDKLAIKNQASIDAGKVVNESTDETE